MSWWGGYEPTRRIPVKDGIKTKGTKIGATWWAKRWIQALESFTDSARLGRGRSYARAGQVMSFDLSPGLVKARVQGSRPTPYKVEIHLDPLTDAQWEKVVHALSEQAIFAAQLLAGEMPRDIEQAFQAAGVPLFPERAKEIRTQCSCPDWANPCKHVAAVHYVLGDQFDDDPFLLFRLRGRDREALLAELRALRSAGAEAEEAQEAPPDEVVPLSANPSDFWEPGEALLAFHPDIRPPAVEGALLKRLPPPSFGQGKIDAPASLTEAYHLLTERALATAFGEGASGREEG